MTLEGTRTGSAPDLALGAEMLAFDGFELPEDVATRLGSAPVAGLSLFRFSNVDSPTQVRALTAAFQAAARARPGADADLPVLVAADQEGGQLIGLGDGTTPFPGAMALGAAGDPVLAERVGRAIGRECAALGVNVAYAPVCDLATNPRNPAVGIRSFGDDPAGVGPLVAAFVRGLQSAGVAAALKHFPGIGDVSDDTHHRLPALDVDAAALAARELVPFRAGIEAGARLVMSAHLAVPRLTGDPGLPSTMSRRVMTGLLRGELGFDGVTITDALDMRAIPQGPRQVDAVIAAMRAGVDLLLTAPDPAARERIEAGLRDAESRGLLDEEAGRASAGRAVALRRWLADRGGEQPDVGIVGCEEHQDLARELAARSLTVVRDDVGLLPLRLPAGARVAAIQPAPTDLTPADTSSAVAPGLAAALRSRFAVVDELVAPHAPSDVEIAGLRDAVRGHDAIVVGTTAALLVPAQAALVEAILGLGLPTVTVALRAPFDLAAYPAARCHVAAYGILAPTLRALADALAGEAGFPGRLPAGVPGLYPTGHGLAS
ncbi:MAG TPA: glycoside hydrolase family 3 N-terminal domain-containing protein [Candidatus Limnocylindrales bacterium]|nr:glycoside hydrolase family 3 N-terminal domain-containing protein [Candidatus Limnocylindrales bacterium]